ncbi:hypothetical protein LINPERHAP1_LOCUS17397, partial [Linum perenne]
MRSLGGERVDELQRGPGSNRTPMSDYHPHGSTHSKMLTRATHSLPHFEATSTPRILVCLMHRSPCMVSMEVLQCNNHTS